MNTTRDRGMKGILTRGRQAPGRIPSGECADDCAGGGDGRSAGVDPPVLWERRSCVEWSGEESPRQHEGCLVPLSLSPTLMLMVMLRRRAYRLDISNHSSLRPFTPCLGAALSQAG